MQERMVVTKASHTLSFVENPPDFLPEVVELQRVLFFHYLPYSHQPFAGLVCSAAVFRLSPPTG
jgi:hypothetical protein